MLLSEVNGEYQKKRMIVYNADGTKPIVHNIEVAPIFGNIYMSRLEKSDTCSYAACDLYLYLEDHGMMELIPEETLLKSYFLWVKKVERK